MDNLNIDKKYYVGSPKLGNWSSVYTYKPRNDHIFEEKGEIFAVISLNGPRGFNASTAGNFILDHLHETYFEGEDTSPLICLEKAVISAARKLAEIVDNDQNVGDHGINLDIAAMSVVGKISYFVNLGQGAIYLSRNERAVDVNQALKDPDGRGYLRSASTVINEDDRVLLLTPQGKDAYLREEISDSLQKFDADMLKDKPLEDESSLSIILVGFELDPSTFIKEDVVEEKLEVKKEDKVKNFITTTELIQDKNPKTNIDTVDKDDSVRAFTERRKEETQEVQPQEDQIVDENEDINIKEDGPSKNRFSKAKSKFKLDKSILDKAKKNLSEAVAKVKDGQFVDKVKQKWENISPDNSEETTFVYIINKIKAFFSKVYTWLKVNFWEGFLQMDQGIYLKNARRGTNWRFIGFIALVAILLIGFSANQISRSQERARIQQEIESTLNVVSENVENIAPEITSIIGQPDIYVSNKNQYQTQLNQFKNQLNSLDKENLSEEQLTQVNNLLAQIQIQEDRLNRVVSVEEPEVIVDFIQQVGEGVTLSDMEIFGDTIFVADSSRGVIYQTDSTGTNVSELASGLQSPKSIIMSQNDDLIGVDNSNQPFFSVNPNNGEVSRLAGVFGEGLNAVTELESYTDRIYLSKPSAPQISYIVEEGAGYRGIINRISNEQYSSLKDFEISGQKFFFLLPGEPARRVFGDNVEDYSLQGASENILTNINSASALEVAGDYIIYGSPSSRSVLFTTKTRGTDETIADYIGQIKYTGSQNYLNDIKEIKINLSTGEIYVLDSSRVLRFEIRDIKQFEY